QRLRERRTGEPAVAADADPELAQFARLRTQRAANGLGDFRSQRLAHDAADIVRLEDFCWERGHGARVDKGLPDYHIRQTAESAQRFFAGQEDAGAIFAEKK